MSQYQGNTLRSSVASAVTRMLFAVILLAVFAVLSLSGVLLDKTSYSNCKPEGNQSAWCLGTTKYQTLKRELQPSP